MMDNNGYDDKRVFYCAETQTVDYDRPPPPPYSPNVTSVSATTQPSFVHHTVLIQSSLRSNPTVYNCPGCFKRIITRVVYVNTRKTHLIAGFICGFTFWCLLCCLAAVPYVIPTFKRAEHYCPNCNAFIGSYSM